METALAVPIPTLAGGREAVQEHPKGGSPLPEQGQSGHAHRGCAALPASSPLTPVSPPKGTLMALDIMTAVTESEAVSG